MAAKGSGKSAFPKGSPTSAMPKSTSKRAMRSPVPGGTTNLTTSKAKASRQNGKSNQNVKTSGRGMQTGGGKGQPKSNASKGGKK